MRQYRSFFDNNPAIVARKLLGTILVRKTKQGIIKAKIIETEAYGDASDLASHARFGKTKRSSIMFGHSGILYVYLNYGIFNLTNIICGPRGKAGAVLIRSAEIFEGQNIALDNLERNKFVKANDFLATGPGKLSVALNIMTKQNGLDITTSKEIFIDLAKSVVPPSDIIKTKRVGVEYAGKSKRLPWRFYIKNNNFVSYR